MFLLINPLNAELHPICHLLVLLGAHHILHVSRIRVKTTSDHFVSGSTVPSGSWPPLSGGFWITHNDTQQSVGLL
jgi:hypothetical protein